MSTTPLKPNVAQARHARQVNGICKGLGVSVEEISWSYDWAVRIDGNERAVTHKGIDIFKRDPGRYVICLVGTLGRKRRQEILDARTMADDPAQLPREIFEIAKPQGPSLWIWQPRRAASPGWNEAVVISSLTDPKTGALEIQAMTDNGQTEVFTRRDTKWEAEISPISTRRWAPVSAENVVAELERGCMVAGEVSIADLLQELGAGDSFMPEGLDDNTDQAPAPGTGRRWDWAQAISEQELAPYTSLIGSLQGRSSGGLMDVLESLGNPVNHIKREVAETMLAGLARGQDAIEAARAAIEAHPELPSLPEGETDIAAFIQGNAKSAAPVGIRPVALGRR